MKIKRRWGCREVSCLALVIVFLVLCGLVLWGQNQDKRAFQTGSTRTATPKVALTSTPKLLLTGISTPIATPIRTLAPTPQPPAEVTAEALNLRAGPGVSYDKVGLLHQGEGLTVTARTEAGDWLAVTLLDGTEGWVSAAYVDLHIPLDAIAVAGEIPATPTPAAPTPTPTPAAPTPTLTVDEQIERIAKGKHSELPQPSEVGGVVAGGEAEVTIINDTPYVLTILVGTPNSVSISMEACPTCKTYSFVGPVFCPEEGRPRKTVKLKPGTCQVSAEVSDPSVVPFYGVWDLKGDTSYFNCFYIVTTLR
ncbi:MAG: SH3 domain-containing protein [Anaerolineales bacterium]|nr:MAG: SH3 domain-containing protein [Anaerolineales bacterium]